MEGLYSRFGRSTIHDASLEALILEAVRSEFLLLGQGLGPGSSMLPSKAGCCLGTSKGCPGRHMARRRDPSLRVWCLRTR